MITTKEKIRLIKALRKEHKTYDEIGKLLRVSLQRICQLYSDGKYNTADGPFIKKKCPICGNVRMERKNKNKKTCSTKCGRLLGASHHKKYHTPEEKRLAACHRARLSAKRLLDDPTRHKLRKKKMREYYYKNKKSRK